MRYQFLAPWKFSPQSSLFAVADDYRGRLQSVAPSQFVLSLKNIQDAQASHQFLEKEVTRARNEGLKIVALDERGKCYSSFDFAQCLERWARQTPRGVCFCIGGAFGLPALSGDVELLSLSAMTFPHELAFVVCVEQVYRAQMILAGHPYHHGEASLLSRHKGK